MQNNGTETIAGTDETADLDTFINEFGEILNDLLQNYAEAKKNETVEPVKASVIRAMALFKNCNVSENNYTVKFIAIVIISNVTSFLPIVFNGVTLLSTQRNNINEWTAEEEIYFGEK